MLGVADLWDRLERADRTELLSYTLITIPQIETSQESLESGLSYCGGPAGGESSANYAQND